MQVRVGYDPRSCTYQGIAFPKNYTTDMEAARRSKLNVQQQQDVPQHPVAARAPTIIGKATVLDDGMKTEMKRLLKDEPNVLSREAINHLVASFNLRPLGDGSQTDFFDIIRQHLHYLKRKEPTRILVLQDVIELLQERSLQNRLDIQKWMLVEMRSTQRIKPKCLDL
jgi:hypothetical protein